MRVAHISTVHPYYDVRIFLKECRSLVAAGHDVHFIVPKPDAEPAEGVTYHALSYASGRLNRFVIRQFQALKIALKLKADIYHFHDPELVPMGLVLRLCGYKVIYDAHEDLPRQIDSKRWIPQKMRRPLAVVIEWIEDFAAKRFSAVVTATPKIAQRFAKLNPKTVDINNYPMLGELTPMAEKPYADREKSALYLGILTPERGGIELVKAADMAGMDTYSVGHIYPDSLMDDMKKMPGFSRMHFPGQVSREAVADYLARARIGIVCFHPYPNHVDAQPNKLFEYMTVGIPVVASNFPLWKKFVEDTGCGICVDPLDAKAIADAMTWLVEHPAEAEAMGKRGREAVEKFYTWDNEAEKLCALYEELA